MKRVMGLVMLLLLLCTGCSSRQTQLEAYFLPLLQEEYGADTLKLFQGSDGHWYLGTWDHKYETSELDLWRMWQLDYEQHALITQPCADFKLTVEVVKESPTKLHCHLTNTRENQKRITYGGVEGLEVKLDGEWYDLPDLRTAGFSFTDYVEYGETATVKYTALLNKALTLPPGTYRVTQILYYNEQTVYATGEFEIR